MRDSYRAIERSKKFRRTYTKTTDELQFHSQTLSSSRCQKTPR